MTLHPHRVLHVVPHLIHGGTEFYVLRVCAALDRDRFTPHVAYLGSRADIIEQYRAKGIEPIAIGHRGPRTAVRTIWRLVRLIKKLRLDIIQTHSRADRLYGQIAALLTGTPVVDTLHSQYAAERYASIRGRVVWRRRLRLLVEDILSRRTLKAIVGVSEAVADTWREMGSAVDWRVKDLFAVPPPLQFSDYSRATNLERDSLLAALGIRDRWPIMINVGRMVSGKNHEALVPVMKVLSNSHPQAALLLVGDGPRRNNIEEDFHRAGLAGCVRFLGTRDDVPAILSIGDAFLFPSLSEGLSLVVIEAVASELPILAFDLPPLRELIAQGINGYRVTTGDVAKLTEMAIHLVETLPSLAVGAAGVRKQLQPRLDGTQTNQDLDRIYSSARGYS